ncbi:DUF485 domain-containing protein [Propionicimonas sp.]|uniref:DUF485 domain-containing protein n=1 Tax=Propionicimonas sp. TaxID=1955623 RepID=UPI0025D4985A|nr:DUF485 domain-containing protein [Propionicimonas sp.]MCG2804024.1 DUF485 domain-containing protein [Propionicimonas sp.]
MTHSQSPDGPPDEDSPEFHLPPDHWPLPELSTFEAHPHPSANRYVAARDSEEYQKLRKSFTNFAFPIVITVLVWYFAYVLMSTYAVGIMKTPGWGGLNLGFWLSLAQFPTTWFATWLYVRHANNKLDPLAATIRAELEAEEAK